MSSVRAWLVAFLCVGVALFAVVVYARFPLGAFLHPDIKPGIVAHPVGIYLHVFAAATALLLGPFQFRTRRWKDRIHFHRWMGRVYLGVGVLIGGLSGLYMSLFAFGGTVARLGFAALALCWLYTGLRAYQSIRNWAIQEHQIWMQRNFALTFAAVMLRIYFPAAVMAGIDPAVAYPAIAWSCWVPNLLVVEWARSKTATSLASVAGSHSSHDVTSLTD